jgi:hypothetical protein
MEAEDAKRPSRLGCRPAKRSSFRARKYRLSKRMVRRVKQSGFPLCLLIPFFV